MKKRVRFLTQKEIEARYKRIVDKIMSGYLEASLHMLMYGATTGRRFKWDKKKRKANL